MYDPRTTLMTISNQLFRQPLIRAQWERWHRAAEASQQAEGSQYTKAAISGGLLCTIIALRVWYHYHFRAARTKAIARIWMLPASWVSAEKLRPDSAKRTSIDSSWGKRNKFIGSTECIYYITCVIPSLLSDIVEHKMRHYWTLFRVY